MCRLHTGPSPVRTLDRSDRGTARPNRLVIPPITARDRRGRLEVGVARTTIGFGRATIAPDRKPIGDVREVIGSEPDMIEVGANARETGRVTGPTAGVSPGEDSSGSRVTGR